MIVVEFLDYAHIWWNKYQRERFRDEEPEVDTWAEMRRVMRRYVPTSYSRTVCLELQKLSQGNMSVEEYYKGMEMTLIRANIDEDNEATIVVF